MAKKFKSPFYCLDCDAFAAMGYRRCVSCLDQRAAKRRVKRDAKLKAQAQRIAEAGAK